LETALEADAAVAAPLCTYEWQVSVQEFVARL
jgi:hypothetical protein